MQTPQFQNDWLSNLVRSCSQTGVGLYLEIDGIHVNLIIWVLGLDLYGIMER